MFTVSWYVVHYVMENKIYIYLPIPTTHFSNSITSTLHHPIQSEPSGNFTHAPSHLVTFPYGSQSDSFNLWVKCCSKSSSIFSSNSESNLKMVQSFTWSKCLIALSQLLSLAGLLVSPAIPAIVSSKYLQYSKSIWLQDLGNHRSLH